ncbi:hypothetical protein RB653_008109 [Dictyostelium firmibasis]|uniref:Uncharacterized protein n=1 Tax=Dictyostelium firmibasis TaxID=79012 RepID=A0AAN7TZL5_9MYCE
MEVSLLPLVGTCQIIILFISLFSNGICQEFVEPKSTSCTPNTISSNQYSEYQSCSCSDGTCYQTSPYPPKENQLIFNDYLIQCAYDNGCALGDKKNIIYK